MIHHRHGRGSRTVGRSAPAVRRRADLHCAVISANEGVVDLLAELGHGVTAELARNLRGVITF
jgi:hypothetical protein